jgi:hypothetical protein
MLFDFAQTSKVSTRKLERLYASRDLRKTLLSVWKRSFQTTKRQMCVFSFGSCHSERSPPARKEVHHFRSTAREREGLHLTIPSLKYRYNHLELSHLRNFTAKISASLVT